MPTPGLLDYRRQIAAIREGMRATLAAAEPEEVDDYVFTGPKRRGAPVVAVR